MYVFYSLSNKRRDCGIAFIIFIILLIPIIRFAISAEGNARFNQTSTFLDYTTLSSDSKKLFYPLIIVKNYIAHFSFNFLFSYGDRIGRHQMPGFGLLPLWQLPFYLAGLFTLFRIKTSWFAKIVLWLLVLSPLASILARPSPQSLRSLLLVIPITLVLSLGIAKSIPLWTKYKYIPAIFYLLFVIYESFLFSHSYREHYSKVNLLDWGGGYKEIVKETNKVKNIYDEIIIEESFEIAPLYYQFYNSEVIPKVVDISWKKPKEWENKKVLYIRSYYGQENPVTITE